MSSSINLVKGWPSTKLLPARQISEAAQLQLANPEVAHAGLLYGPDDGFKPLRESLSRFLTTFYNHDEDGDAIEPEEICITGGASQNLGCMLQVFTDPLFTRSVQIIAPAYMLSFRMFADNGFSGKMKAVPENEDGVDTGSLRRSLQESEDQAKTDYLNAATTKPQRPYSKYYRHVIYCVPTFSNPSSRSMSLERRTELVRIAREFDALIIADDVYDYLQWPSHPTEASIPMTRASFPRLVDIDRALDGGASRPGADGFGNAMSNGSFSKISGPGVRVGWVQGTAKFAWGVSQCGTSCSGGAPSQLTSTFMDCLLRQGKLQTHVFDVLCPAYAQRYKTLVEAVETELFPLGASMPQADRQVVGGFFIWVTLPKAIMAEELAHRCQDEVDVFVAPGSIFEVPGDESVKFDHNIRLCFSWLEPEDMVEGVKRIRMIVESMLRGEKAKSKGKSQKGLGQIK
ncbi:hypothetical protein AAFC00_003535 [Neodothiora populina]|uniref:Aminotransferase class I/classII large domain-containing protein n=1 Tax=Neodothiora populina TaxID=2781224 RepID=A0ABR3PEK8_9PEZI